jgi:hypothetical protein
MDLIIHLARQRQFSEATFGPYSRPGRTAGVIKHLEKEVGEVRKDPADLLEWIDCAILAFEGALSQGYTPKDIARALEHKQDVNESRVWPDWRTTTPGEAIEHVRKPMVADQFGGFERAPPCGTPDCDDVCAFNPDCPSVRLGDDELKESDHG